MKTETLVIGGIVVAAGGYILWKRHKAAVASAAAFGATAGISAMGGISNSTSPLPSAAPSLAPDMAARQALIASSGLISTTMGVAQAAPYVPVSNPNLTAASLGSATAGNMQANASPLAFIPAPQAPAPSSILPSIFAARSRLPALSIPKGF
jgi:hypothetical protein